MTADEFVTMDQSLFGDAWRYELVGGVIIAHAAPSPTHGVIVAAALWRRLIHHGDGCRVEAGSAAAPAQMRRDTACVPGALLRCRGLPRATFEVVSPSELRGLKARDRKREDVKDVGGVMEIVEIDQHTIAVHVHARTEHGFDPSERSTKRTRSWTSQRRHVHSAAGAVRTRFARR